MTTLTELQKINATLKQTLADNEAAIEDKQRKTVVKCEPNAAYGTGCGNKFFIKNLVYTQTHWYETPSGCSDGDTWHRGEGQFECPICHHRNRFYDKPEIVKLKHLFAEIFDEHKD